jgi:radical SAM superfamily enzyme YgiQ (UPF0313 family)
MKLASLMKLRNMGGTSSPSKSGSHQGYPIVLTASRSELSSFNGDPFGAFIATFPKKLIPRQILKEDWFSSDDDSDGSSRFMPYGLRKVESMLVDEFGRSNVIAVHPDNLDRFVGPNTKVVGISSMDPMGSAEFFDLINHPSISKHGPKVIVGGAGAWQIRDSRKVDEFNINCLVHGEGESLIVDLFKKAFNGEGLPKEVYAKRVPMEQIPVIKKAASYGVVEITRGCGRGCQFCSPTNRTKHFLPLEHIMKEVEVNVKHGSNSIFTATEDMFLYKCGPKFAPNRKAIVELYKNIASYPGVDFIHLSHCSLAPVVNDPKMLEEVTPYLMEKTRYTPQFRKGYKKPFVTSLFGIESGSTRIMKKYMKGKALPYDIEDWHDVVVQGAGIFNDNGWRPMGTIITGWPDENTDDTIETLELLDRMKDINMFYVPLLFIPLEDSLMRNERSIKLDYLNDLQWEFISKCWRYNIKNWASEMQLTLGFAALFSYVFYFRWKHGRKILRPTLTLAGLESLVQKRPVRECDKEICAEPIEQ